MTYKSTQNQLRATRGTAAVELHPDYRSGGIDFETAATDMIANVLHALNAQEPGVLDLDDVLGRAANTYLGDFEDEPAPCGLL